MLKVTPLETVEKPVILVFGVNVSSDMIAIRLPSLNNFVIFCVTSVESNMASKVKPFVFPVVLGGPTKTLAEPL